MAADILDALGPEYAVMAVIGEMFEERWTLRIQKGQERIFDVVLERGFVDDLLDSGLAGYRSDLKNRILKGLGREELAERS